MSGEVNVWTPKHVFLHKPNTEFEKKEIPAAERGAEGVPDQLTVTGSKHTSRSTVDWLATRTWRVLDWLRQSPDLDPAEMLGGDLKQKISQLSRYGVGGEKTLLFFTHVFN